MRMVGGDNTRLVTLLAVSIAVLLLPVRSARSASISMPTLPEWMHDEFVDELGFDEAETRLARLAYDRFVEHHEDAIRAYTVRWDWITAMSEYRFGASDDELSASMTEAYFVSEPAMHRAVERAQARYFDTLAEIDGGRTDRIASLERRWLRWWLLRSPYLPHDAVAGAKIDLINVLDQLKIDPEEDPSLEQLVSAYEREADDILQQLRSAMISGRSESRALRIEVRPALERGDKQTALKNLKEAFDLEFEKYTLLDEMRALNVEFARRISTVLPWRLRFGFHARVRPRLFTYLFDVGSSTPDQILARAARSVEDSDEEAVHALLVFAEDYDGQFLELVAGVDHLYMDLHGGELREQRRLRDVLVGLELPVYGDAPNEPAHAYERRLAEALEVIDTMTERAAQLTEALK